MNESIRVHKALTTIARILDQLENIPSEAKAKKEFRSRLQLINDILDGKE